MLSKVLKTFEDLRQVRITQATLCQQLGKIPTFSEYLDLLTNAATIYDDHQQQGNVPRNDSASRRVYATQATNIGSVDDYHLDNDRFDVFQDDRATFDLDEPISTITAYTAQPGKWILMHGYPMRYLPDSAWMINAHGHDSVQTHVL